MILVPLFDLKFLGWVCGKCCGNFRSAVLEQDPQGRDSALLAGDNDMLTYLMFCLANSMKYNLF